jgi:3-hydroxyacyl-CoA dehydrogenase
MLLMLEAQEGNFEEIDLIVRHIQNANMALKLAPKPVVVAPFGMALGGGLEVTLHGTSVQASAESYMGLVELGVGLIPAGGGTKELLIRKLDAVGPNTDPFPAVREAFETIGMAKVAKSACEARAFGYLRDRDGISMNRDRLTEDAKAMALSAARRGFRPQTPREEVTALGANGLATLKLGLHQMKRGGYISDYDYHIGTKLAHILTGGDLSHQSKVTEQRLLDLEREAFLSLCGERKTLERIQHMLKTGKPLRN